MVIVCVWSTDVLYYSFGWDSMGGHLTITHVYGNVEHFILKKLLANLTRMSFS